MIQHNNYKNVNLQQILETFSHYQKINFAFYCAKDVESLANDQRVIDCNNTIQSWLNGDKSVDLITARANALDAAYSTATAAAAYAASAAYSTAATATATATAAYATTSVVASAAAAAAHYASRAKAWNLHPNNKDKINFAYTQFFKEYEQIAKNWLSLWNITNFPKESDFPIFDYLQDYNLISYLLPKKEDYYYLNLNGFDIKHESEAELLKEIDTMHIKTILRRIINNDSAQQL